MIELTLPLLLAFLAYSGGGLDILGSLTGAIMGYMILFSQDFNWVILLLVFFVIGSFVTKYKYKKKEKYGVSEKKRHVENVLGNGLAALFFALQGNIFGFCGSLSAATSDTFSSEIGMLSKKAPVSILDLKTSVKRGENGGVSTLGNIAMFLGSGLIAVTTLILFQDWGLFWVTLWAGVFGSIIDSLIGAIWENKGYIGNSAVNFLMTFLSGLFAVIISSLI